MFIFIKFSFDTLLLLRFFSLQLFNDDVPSHAKDKKNYSSDDLGEDTDPGGVGDEGKEEAHGLPEPVVGEGGLLVVGKEAAIEGVDLGLPDRVTNSPEGGKEVDNSKCALGRGPRQHHNDHQGIEACTQDEDGHPSDFLDDESKADGGKCVTNSEKDQNSSNCVDAISTCHKSLQNGRKVMNRFFFTSIDTHSGEISSEESLLDARPKGERDDEQLLLPDHVPEGGHK